MAIIILALSGFIGCFYIEQSVTLCQRFASMREERPSAISNLFILFTILMVPRRAYKYNIFFDIQTKTKQVLQQLNNRVLTLPTLEAQRHSEQVAIETTWDLGMNTQGDLRQTGAPLLKSRWGRPYSKAWQVTCPWRIKLDSLRFFRKASSMFDFFS